MDGGRDGSGENADGQRNTWAAGSGSEKTSNKQLYKSEKFDEYYKAMNIMPESEWETFLEVMQSPLPVTFRINPLAPTAALVRQRLQSDPKWSQPFVMDDGRTVQPPRSLTWYPDAWQLGYGKPDLRKNSSLKAFHEWLIVLTAEGAISRQEAVSMIPPLLLDVQPHHEVLDMCAAPGSKTAQLLEALHAGELRGEVATGMVVANDSDSKRAYLLTHQCSRIGSPALMVTCHDAQIFPNLNKGAPRPVAAAGAAGADAAATAAAEKAARGNGQRTPGCFDRVLCDVPCSGDGTGRKNADVFTRWSPAAAIALHPLQIQIAMRGLALLKVGGLMAYSTCSLNPIEDEAVVAEILRRCGGAVELVDASKILPGLIYSPGKTEWTVMDKDMRTHASYEAALGPNENGHVSKAARKLYASCFAPAPEVVATYNLQHCMRVLPHQQDTGGFFICLFKKTAPLPSSMPWFDASAAKATAGASSGADAASSSSSGPASASGAAPAKATALDDADSEDEIDAAVTRPFYGRAGPGSSAEPFTGVALPPGSSQTHYVSAAGAGAAEPASSPSAEGDDEEAAAAAVVGQEAAADDDAEDNDGEDAEDDDADEEAAPSGAGAAAPTATVVATGANSRMVLPTGKQPVDRDSKGRALSGRFEMTVYTPVDPRSVVELHSVFGLTDAFPDHLLFTRSESSRAVTLVAEPVAKLVLPQQKTITGEGRVKTVNTGIKVFGENRGDKYKEKMDAKLLQQQSAASTGGDVQMSEPAEASSSSSSLSSAAVAGASATTTGTVERFGPGYAGLLNSDYRLMQVRLILRVLLLRVLCSVSAVHAAL